MVDVVDRKTARLDARKYVPRAMTPLLDAVGRGLLRRGEVSDRDPATNRNITARSILAWEDTEIQLHRRSLRVVAHFEARAHASEMWPSLAP